MKRFLALCLLLVLTAACPLLSAAGAESEFSVPLEEARQLFASLSETPLMACSGAGAWEGRLKIDADGSFTGYYYDADAGDEVVYEVSFFGSFGLSATEQWGYASYGLWVESLNTRQPPGTQAYAAYGGRIVYDEPPFHAGDYLLLTLPGADSDAVPEMVQGEIGGTLDEWEDYTRFITLTRLDDGWGFFADPDDPPAYDLEPIPPAASAPTLAPAPAKQTDWTGYWMTRDDSLAELIITDNGNGTLHARALFLPSANFDATLTPRADGSMRFEDEYGALIGLLTRQEDGTLRFTVTGGYAYDDEEATEYHDYYARGFTYSPAAYGEMWYQAPWDAAGPEDDWLGEWTVKNISGASTLHIQRSNETWNVDAALGRYHFSGLAELDSDTVMSLYGDDFSCMLMLNRKLNRIAMMEVGSAYEGVYDFAGSPYYGVLIYQKADGSSASPEETGAAPTQGPSGGLQPIPGKSGYLQVPVSRVDATSYIEGKSDPDAYAPSRMIDGEESTAFQFSTKTTRLGEACLYFDFDAPVTLDELWMKNGFWKITNGNNQYTRNSRVKKMTIFVRTADSGAYQMLKEVTLKDDGAWKDWKVIRLNGAENVTGVRIRIDAIYAGSKYKTDVCISEIMFVQKTDK